MTISSVVTRIDYTGNGSTTDFPITFKFDSEDDILLYVDGVETTTGFSVTGGDGESGTLVFDSAPANLADITIIDNPVIEQMTDWVNGGKLDAETLERAIDKLTRLVIRLHDKLDSVPKVSGDNLDGITLALPEPDAGMVIGWNATADGLDNIDPASSSVDAAASAADAEASAAASAASAAQASLHADDASSLLEQCEAAAGVIAGFEWASAWTTATYYEANNLVRDSGSTYICLVAHTSGTFSTDLTAGKWTIFAQKGDAGAGAGDMVGANNLSDVASAATSRANLGLTIGTHVQAYDADLTTLAGLAKTDGNFIVGDGTNWVVESGATARASLGLTIGTHVQAYDADLTTLAGLAKTDGNIIVGNGTDWVVESGATARASLGITEGSVNTATNFLFASHCGNKSDFAISTNTQTVAVTGKAGVIECDGIGSPLLAITEQTEFTASMEATFVCVSRQKDANGNRVYGLASDLSDSTPTNGIFFRHSNTGNYYAVCRSSNTETATDTGVAASTSTWRTLKIVSSASSCAFYIDDVLEATITTNIPSSAMACGAGAETSAAWQIDFMSMEATV